MNNNLEESILTKIVVLSLALLLFCISFYMVYAVIKKKPLSDPNDPNNFIANLPFWSKSLHKVKLLLIGGFGSAFFLWYIIQYLIKWFSD